MFYVQNGLETTGHLLLHCPIARCLWDLAFSCLGLCWVMPSYVSHQLSMWEGFLGRRAKIKVFQSIPHAIFWLLWMERNRGVYEGTETSLEWLNDEWLKTLFVWEEEVFVPRRWKLLILWIAYSCAVINFVEC